MATVTGFTADRMLQIENETIISGEVVGDDLILETREGTPINAGNVRGATGSPGITESEMNDIITANTMPVGSIVDYISTDAPTGWFAMIGQTITDGQTLYPELWALLPASMQSGANIVLPDTRGRMTVGLDSSDTLFDTIGETGGSKNAVVVTHNHTGPSHTHSGPSHVHTIPNHSHSINHDHPSVTSTSAGTHDHNIPTHNVITGTGNLVTQNVIVGTVNTTQIATTDDGAHTHSVNLPSFSGTSGSDGAGNTGAAGTGNTGAAGTGATSTTGESGVNKNLPPYIVFLKIIKAI